MILDGNLGYPKSEKWSSNELFCIVFWLLMCSGTGRMILFLSWALAQYEIPGLMLKGEIDSHVFESRVYMGERVGLGSKVWV